MLTFTSRIPGRSPPSTAAVSQGHARPLRSPRMARARIPSPHRNPSGSLTICVPVTHEMGSTSHSAAAASAPASARRDSAPRDAAQARTMEASGQATMTTAAAERICSAAAASPATEATSFPAAM